MLFSTERLECVWPVSPPLLPPPASHASMRSAVMVSRTERLLCVWLLVYAVSQFVTLVLVMPSRTVMLLCVWLEDPLPPPPCSSVATRLFRSHPRAADRIQPAFVLSYVGQAPLTGSRRS